MHSKCRWDSGVVNRLIYIIEEAEESLSCAQSGKVQGERGNKMQEKDHNR